MSRMVPLPDPLPPLSFHLGEPLLYRAASWLLWGTPPDGYTLNMHPMAFAAWFGLFATALNLIPIGQLDGGHVSYAVLGRKSSYVTLGMIGVAVVLTYFSTSWLVWTALMVVMLVLFGRHHPRTYDEHVPLDSGRMAVAAFALLMFVVCFTPFPFEPAELIRQGD
jgi:membrane-associated protease RseP (regulator of RpoE activity)